MKELHLDIETYSSVDLAECGVYRYAESPDFEILLFGWSADGGEVKVIDLARGETIPEETLAALKSRDVIKTAHNANFERVCLLRHLGMKTGEYLPPESWRCSMVWAAVLGLPQSLDELGRITRIYLYIYGSEVSKTVCCLLPVAAAICYSLLYNKNDPVRTGQSHKSRLGTLYRKEWMMLSKQQFRKHQADTGAE